jgi:hypothetical protein
MCDITGIYLSYENRKYIPGIYQVYDFPGKKHICGVYLLYTFLVPFSYTRYIPGISFPSQSVLQQNRAWGVHAHRFWLARCLMFITATRNPSALAAAAIATAADSDSEAEAGAQGCSPFSLPLLWGLLLWLNQPGLLVSFAGRRRRRPGRRCRRRRRCRRWGGSPARACVAGAGDDAA